MWMGSLLATRSVRKSRRKPWGVGREAQQDAVGVAEASPFAGGLERTRTGTTSPPSTRAVNMCYTNRWGRSRTA